MKRDTSLTNQTGRSRRRGRRLGISLVDSLQRAGLPLALAALVIYFSTSSVTGDLFVTTANVQSIFANQSVTGLVAIAMIIPLVCGYFDLSVAATASLANVSMAALISSHGFSVAGAMVGALAISLIVGLFNAILVATLRLSAFICTLGTMILIGGLLDFYTEGRTISNGIPAGVGEWGSGAWLGMARPFWLLMLVAVVVWYLLTQTPFGRKLEAIGSNESAARLTGIRVDRAIFVSFLSSALIAGIAGVLLTSREGGATAANGSVYLFPAIAAVFLGQTAIRPGTYNVWGTMIGVYFVAIAVNGFTLMGAHAWVTPVFNGGSLVGAVVLSTLLGRRAENRTRSPRPSQSADDRPAQELADVAASEPSKV